MIYVWHAHHNILISWYNEMAEVEARRAFVAGGGKPEHEIPTRLRLMKPVEDQNAVAQAWRAFDEAVVSAGRADDEATPAWRALAAVAALHARECVPDCPWNGSTIFPGPFSGAITA